MEEGESLMENACLTTNAHTTESILFWSYGISNRSGVKSLDLYIETRGAGKVRMDDLRIEAALVQKTVNKLLQQPHLRAILEAKYGEKREAVTVCAVTLRKTARTQSVESLCRVVEDFCQFRRYRDREAMLDWKTGASKSRESKCRYLGILEGWHWIALEIVEDAFREKGWVG